MIEMFVDYYSILEIPHTSAKQYVDERKRPMLQQNQKRCSTTHKPTLGCTTFAFAPIHPYNHKQTLIYE
jgi:hypothetical protein